MDRDRRAHLIWDLGLIALVGAVCHGAMLLNDGVYWDGWLVHTLVQGNSWEDLRIWFSESGVPQVAYLHWWLGHLSGGPLALRAVSFVSLIGGACLIRWMGVESRLVDRQDALAIALLSLTAPLCLLAVFTILTPYYLCLLLFLAAAALALRAERCGWTCHIILRVSALALFLISFTMNSLLVLHFGFLTLLVLVIAQRETRPVTPGFVARISLRRADYLALPFVFWAVTRVLFPVHGLYGTYNQISLSPRESLLSLLLTARHTVTQTLDALQGFSVLWAAVLGISVWALWRWRGGEVEPENRFGRPRSLLIFGLVLYGLAIFPYIAVGKHPGEGPNSMRHAILHGLPVAILLLGAIRLLLPSSRDPRGLWRWMVIATLVAAFSLAHIRSLISWQADWAKERAIMLALSRRPDAVGHSTFWVDDLYRIDGRHNRSFYVWSSIFNAIWGDQAHAGFAIQERDREDRLRFFQVFYTRKYSLGHFDPSGPQATLTIRQGQPYTTRGLAGRYLIHRFLQPGQMDQFLSSVVEIDLEPFEPPQRLIFEDVQSTTSRSH